MTNTYIQLLSYAASDCNNGQIPAKNKRQVYQSEVQEDDFNNYEDNFPDSEPFDIDTPVETIQAYAYIAFSMYYRLYVSK
jgi:hypothetical protein